MPDVFITPGSSTIKFVDSGGVPHNITINGYIPDQIQFTGSVVSGNPLVVFQDNTISTLLPGVSGYGLGSPTNRWNIYSTSLDVSGNTNLGGGLRLASGAVSTSPLTFQSGASLSTVSSGAMEWDGVNLYFTPNSTTPARKTIAYLDSSITGTASSVTGIVGYTNGGTGLSFAGTNGQVLSVVSGTPSWATNFKGVNMAIVQGLSMISQAPSSLDIIKIPIPYSPIDGITSVTWTIKRLDFRCETSPVGGPATLNINLNGYPIMASGISIAASQNSAYTNSFSGASRTGLDLTEPSSSPRPGRPHRQSLSSALTTVSGDLMQLSIGSINSSDLWSVYLLLQGIY